MIANNTWAAMQGRKKLKPEWDFGVNADYNSDRIQEHSARDCEEARHHDRTAGDVDAEFAKAIKTHEAEYCVPSSGAR